MRGKKQKEPAGMNPAEIFAALEMLEQERGISKSFMMQKIVHAITTAYQRDHKDVEEENIIVEVDEERKDLRMFVQKAVVDEEDYVDPGNEMSLEEARAISGRYVIDAKSIMGIFSLDLSKPIDLNIHSEGDSGDILSVLAPYLVD